MFKVCHAPFDPSLLISRSAYFALVYEGKRKSRFFVACTCRDVEKRQEYVKQYEIVAECLNEIKSFGFVREMLRSIQYAIQCEEVRRQSYSRPSIRISHRADFGRLDFDRPGQGGTGVDGYW